MDLGCCFWGGAFGGDLLSAFLLDLLNGMLPFLVQVIYFVVMLGMAASGILCAAFGTASMAVPGKRFVLAFVICACGAALLQLLGPVWLLAAGLAAAVVGMLRDMRKNRALALAVVLGVFLAFAASTRFFIHGGEWVRFHMSYDSYVSAAAWIESGKAETNNYGELAAALPEEYKYLSGRGSQSAGIVKKGEDTLILFYLFKGSVEFEAIAYRCKGEIPYENIGPLEWEPLVYRQIEGDWYYLSA